MPEISVVLATYNGAQYIGEAINSIIEQTFQDFEFIIIDDASIDQTPSIVKNINDKRIRYFRNKENKGLAYSLARGFNLARGKYIARMDDDDISLPNRFAVQYEYMEKHSDITVCGSWYNEIGRRHGRIILPETSEKLKPYLLFYSPLAHSSWFVRREHLLMDDFNYNVHYRSSQDYDFLERLLNNNRKIACVQQNLLCYRVRKGSITGVSKKIDKNTIKVQRRILQRMSIKMKRRHVYLLNYSKSEKKDCMAFAVFAYRIMVCNEKCHYFDSVELRRQIKFRFWTIFYESTNWNWVEDRKKAAEEEMRGEK
ncbi:MAG: glycosyltransferase family 2 protein [Lachnospiraceae bacterium]|nr:glycosyltransferase family 2 protein [Lachnospiraceae bacterium]